MIVVCFIIIENELSVNYNITKVNIYQTAIRSEMDCIVTRNVKDYMKSSVKVYEPSAFLKLLEAENEIG